MNQPSCLVALALTIFVVAVVSGFKELDAILPQAKQDECRKESNFQGALFGDVNQNVTQELKCFAACSLVKLGLMNEKDGTINIAQLDELIAKHTGGKDAADLFKQTVVEPCLKMGKTQELFNPRRISWLFDRAQPLRMCKGELLRPFYAM